MGEYLIRVDRDLAERIKRERPETTVPRLVRTLLKRELDRRAAERELHPRHGAGAVPGGPRRGRRPRHDAAPFAAFGERPDAALISTA